MDNEMLEAMEKLLDRKLAPVLADMGAMKADMGTMKASLSSLEDKVDYLSEVVEESLALHDELEQRVKVLESKIV